MDPSCTFTQGGEYCAGAAPVGKLMDTSPALTAVVAGSQPFTMLEAPPPPAVLLVPLPHALTARAPVRQEMTHQIEFFM
jgi:hypothetical protein